jgi:hypothetical protein
MAEDWIKVLAKHQLRREKDKVEKDATERASQQDFDAAVAPFWELVQHELEKAVKEYNAAIGRDDLLIPSKDKRVRQHGLELHRGQSRESDCHVNLHAGQRQISVELTYRRRQTTDTGRMWIDLVQEGDSIRAQNYRGWMTTTPGSSPECVARAILSTWASRFDDSPPGR